MSKEQFVERKDGTIYSPRSCFIPTEKRMTNGHLVFETQDKTRYVRMSDTGVIRRAKPKVNGKEAKKARQRCRR